METKSVFVRYPAVKVAVRELLEGKYIREDEQNFNYLVTPTDKKIYRLNLLAVILEKETRGSLTSLLLDDGTGKITARFFEESTILSEMKIGEILMIIGRLRMYNQEKYILPEIVRKVDAQWLKVRALELRAGKDQPPPLPENYPAENESKTFISSPPSLAEEDLSEDLKKGSEPLPTEKLTTLIKELDKGEGVFVEEIMEKSYLKDTELWLEKMLQSGDIFQNLPGRVKVL